MTQSHHTIDVVIPAYNAEKYISATIASVMSQTLSPSKIIIINDGSKDSTEKLVLDAKETGNIPIVYKYQKNKGLSAARNAGLALCDSEFVAFVDADDTWSPEKLEQQIAVYSANGSNVGLVYCRHDTLHSDGTTNTAIPALAVDPSIRGNCFESLLQGNKVLSSASGALIRRAVFDTVGNFDESLPSAEDWDMWLRISEVYEIAYADMVLCHIRKHGSSLTSNEEASLLGLIIFFKKWAQLLPKNYKIPTAWPERICASIIKSIPTNPLLIFTIRKTLPKQTREAFFAATHGSIGAYCILFIARRVVKKIA